MAGTKWTKVARLADLKEGVPTPAQVQDEEIVLVRIGKQVHACSGECTHYGGPLANGLLTGHVLTCPWHNARFDVTAGQMMAGPALDDLSTWAVKVEKGVVYLGEAKRPTLSRSAGRDEREFVIIGGGAAGNAAAEMLRREGFAGPIRLVSAETDLPYDRTALSKHFLAGDMTSDMLTLRSDDFYADLGIDFLGGRRVTEVDPAGREVLLDDGQRLRYDRLLLATGGAPRALEVPGGDLDGVFLLRSLTSGDALRAAAHQAKHAVVVGGSFIAMEVAAALRQRGLDVHVVVRQGVPLERVFGEQVGLWFQRLHEGQGVHVHLGAAVKEVRGKKKVEGVVLNDGMRIAADLVVAGVGVVPVVDYLADTGLVEDGAVPVNGRLETRASGIFAAGDIACVAGAADGEARRIEHWVVAQRMGQHAARNMLGHRAEFDDVPFFWTRQFDISVKYIGHAPQFDRVAVRGDLEAEEWLVGYYQGGVLKAAAARGQAVATIALGHLLQAGRTPSFDRFQDADVDLAALLSAPTQCKPAKVR